MNKRFVPIFALLLGGVGLLSTAMAIGQAPAFVAELRIVGVAGSTRTENTGAMYTRADYLMQTGAGFVNADAYSLATIEAADGADGIAAPEVVTERARRGVELLREAVSRDPANAHAWFVYAQALGATGTPKAAFAALDRSHALSPTMPRLAYLRSWVLWGLLQGVDGMEMDANKIARFREIYSADRELARTTVPEEDLPPPLAAESAESSDAVPGAAAIGLVSTRLTTPALPILAEAETTPKDLYRLALDLTGTDPEAAAIAFAHAALRGHARSAFYLGQLYETGDGVPLNLPLARAWYAAAELSASEHQLNGLAETAASAAPSPPQLLSAARTGDGALELVWAPGASGGTGFLVEVFDEDGTPIIERTLLLSAIQLDAPHGPLTWRVTTLEGDAKAASEIHKISLKHL